MALWVNYHMYFMFPIIHQTAQKGAWITDDRKKLIISLSEKVLKLVSNKLQQLKTQYIAFQIYNND